MRAPHAITAPAPAFQPTRLATALALALSLGAATSAQAAGEPVIMATHVVTNCNDAGPGSLREAAAQAVSHDIIDLGQLSCTEIQLTSGQIQINAEHLRIRGRLDDSDPESPQRPRIRRAASAEPFRLFFHAATGVLTLTHLELSHGRVSVPAFGAFGGCVRSAGHVELIGSTVRNCEAEAIGGVHPARGGGVYATKKVILSANSRVSHNRAKGDLAGAEGGGIFSGSMADVTRGMVADNQVASNNAHASGGGIHSEDGLLLSASQVRNNRAFGADAKGAGVFVPGGSVLVGNSVISGNTMMGQAARGAGLHLGGDNNRIKYSTIERNTTNHIAGGIFADHLYMRGSVVANNTGSSTAGGIYASGSIDIARSTIAGNTSTRVGGADLGDDTVARPIVIEQSTISGNRSGNSNMGGAGLFLRQNATITNSTITGNIERTPDDQRRGAGITLRSGRQLSLSSTVVSGNRIDVDGSLFNSDVGFNDAGSGTATISGSHNLVGHVSPGIAIPGDTLLLADPLLGPLQDNGGPTPTHMPLQFSSTLDNGTANGLATDQRGPGFARVIGLAADIGAVEYDDDRIFFNGFQ